MESELERLRAENKKQNADLDYGLKVYLRVKRELHTVREERDGAQAMLKLLAEREADE